MVYSGSNLFLENFLESLEQWGFVDIMLPFLLVFVIVFAVLEKTKILGEEKKNLNVVLALIMGAAVVFPHVTNTNPLGFDPVEIINGALPSVSVLVVAIMMLMVLIGVFAHDRIFLGLTAPGWIGLFSVIAIVFIFGASAGWWGGSTVNAMEEFFGSDAIAVVIMILVFGIIISFITSGSDEKTSALERMHFNIGELFGGGKNK